MADQKRIRKNRRPKIAVRTCIACRDVEDKRSLIRLVRSPDGIYIDPTSKQAGRGAYLHERQDCWQRALRATQLIGRALKTKVSTADVERLANFAAELNSAVPDGE